MYISISNRMILVDSNSPSIHIAALLYQNDLISGASLAMSLLIGGMFGSVFCHICFFWFLDSAPPGLLIFFVSCWNSRGECWKFWMKTCRVWRALKPLPLWMVWHSPCPPRPASRGRSWLFQKIFNNSLSRLKRKNNFTTNCLCLALNFKPSTLTHSQCRDTK